MLLDLLRDRLLNAISTTPPSTVWLTASGLALLLSLLLIPLGFALGFLNLAMVRSPATIFRIMAIALFTPALTEEVTFRVLLLPHPGESLPPTLRWFWIGISLLLFILYHPLNGFSFFPPGRKIFVQPQFLLLATLLGIICTIAYLQTGSLWLPVAIHWVAVNTWVLLLGGYAKFYEAEPLSPANQQPE